MFRIGMRVKLREHLPDYFNHLSRLTWRNVFHEPQYITELSYEVDDAADEEELRYTPNELCVLTSNWYIAKKFIQPYETGPLPRMGLGKTNRLGDFPRKKEKKHAKLLRK